MTEKTILDHIHDTFVQPEIEYRKTTGKLSDDFRIFECRILLPQDQSPIVPIVQFNNEVGWRTRDYCLAPGVENKAGEPI